MSKDEGHLKFEAAHLEAPTPWPLTMHACTRLMLKLWHGIAQTVKSMLGAEHCLVSLKNNIDINGSAQACLKCKTLSAN